MELIQPKVTFLLPIFSLWLRHPVQLDRPASRGSTRHRWTHSRTPSLSPTPVGKKCFHDSLHPSNRGHVGNKVYLRFHFQKSERQKRRLLVFFLQLCRRHSLALVPDCVSALTRKEPLPVLPLLQPKSAEFRKAKTECPPSGDLRPNVPRLPVRPRQSKRGPEEAFFERGQR